MAAAWSASPTAMVLTASPCSRRTERSWYGPPTATPRSRTKPTSLLRTGYRRGREALALFRFKFLDPQRLVDPVICGTDVFCAGRQVVAFDVGFFAVHQVQVGHGVVVVGAKLNGLVEAPCLPRSPAYSWLSVRRRPYSAPDLLGQEVVPAACRARRGPPCAARSTWSNRSRRQNSRVRNHRDPGRKPCGNTSWSRRTFSCSGTGTQYPSHYSLSASVPHRRRGRADIPQWPPPHDECFLECRPRERTATCRSLLGRDAL